MRGTVSLDHVGPGYDQSIPEIEASLQHGSISPADEAARNIDGPGPDEQVVDLPRCCYATAMKVLGVLRQMDDKDSSLLFFMLRGGSRTEWAVAQGISKQSAHTRFQKLKAKWPQFLK